MSHWYLEEMDGKAGRDRQRKWFIYQVMKEVGTGIYQDMKKLTLIRKLCENILVVTLVVIYQSFKTERKR